MQSSEEEGLVAVVLEEIAPWGRSLEEYKQMFDLSPLDLKSSILDCAGGPSSFNAEMHRKGPPVVSCDPIYRFSTSDITRRIAETHKSILNGVLKNQDNFVWRDIQSPEHLLEIRLRAMRQFLDDFPIGISQNRYRVAELPALPFADKQFDLGLCSHFLFTYSNLLSIEFHLASLRELCRTAREVRVFPLVGQFAVGRCAYVPVIVGKLESEGYQCEVVRVPYEFQKGGNEMLRLSSDSRSKFSK